MKTIGSKSFWKASSGLVGILVVLAIVVAANIILGNLRLRHDFTEEKLYTLSDGSRSVLKKLDRNVTLKLFFSSSAAEVPAFLKTYARQVEDFLEEYRIAGGGRIIVETYDPTPDSDAEDWARRYGLPGQPLGMTGPTVYFGLVAVSGDTEAAIPALDPRAEELLEYSLTRLIYRVTHPDKPVVGVLSSLPVLGATAPPFPIPGQAPQGQPRWVAFQDMEQDYELREVATDTTDIDNDLKALIVVHPKDLPPETLYALDQFVLGGGRLLVFLDPFSIADLSAAPRSPFGAPPEDNASDLNALLTAWGIGYDTNKILMDKRAISRLRGAGNRIEESAVWLTLNPEHIVEGDVVTAQLQTLMMPFAGGFVDNTSDSLTVTPLLLSSRKAGLVNKRAAQMGQRALEDAFRAADEPIPTAIRLSGRFTTAFPDGPPKMPDGDAPPAPTGLNEGTSSVLLVADADMLMDSSCVQPMNFFGVTRYQAINDNIDLVANAVEQIGGSSDLIGIRSRGRFIRPFKRVIALENKARDAWQVQEADLSRKLQETQQQLREMQASKSEGQEFILSPRQQEAIESFRQDEMRIRQELKDVRKQLRGDIERLGIVVKAINIGLIPLLVSVAGIAFGLYRKHRK